jgi:hypothetical protein
MRLINDAPWLAEVTPMFVEQSAKNIWSLNQTMITVLPNATSELVIGCHQPTAEIHRARLAIYVKNNADPFWPSMTGERRHRESNRVLQISSSMSCYYVQRKQRNLNCQILGNFPLFGDYKLFICLGHTFLWLL